ncbi:REX1, REXO1, RNH70 [Ceraceosorus bombacis]|uniref:REX1, REXO1, RNH70 n=1 Tax=Ceraceosorus bombacis TaxID=401625 RepID=A0A0P1BQW4_9BASI|nr:REX1, REXO1, RNH70 [Ceraceosorus bombacis]
MWASKSKKLDESSGTDQSGSQSLAMLLEDAREELKACSYHWGKKSYESEPGHGSRRAGRIVRYTCCDATEQSFSSPSSLASVAASAGFNQASSSAHGHTCSRGPHVWKTDNAKVLHAYEPFRSVAAIRAEMTETDSKHTWSRTQDVVALDAELIFTTAGMSIVRITLVDESGEVLIAGAAGHSSLEDARVAQELVRWKLVEDPHSSPFRERKASAAGSTTSPINPGPESPALAIHSPSTPLTGDFGQYLRPPPSPSLSGPDGGAGPSASHNQGQASGQALPLARTRPAPPPSRINPRAAASLFVPKKRPPPS